MMQYTSASSCRLIKPGKTSERDPGFENATIIKTTAIRTKVMKEPVTLIVHNLSGDRFCHKGRDGGQHDHSLNTTSLFGCWSRMVQTEETSRKRVNRNTYRRQKAIFPPPLQQLRVAYYAFVSKKLNTSGALATMAGSCTTKFYPRRPRAQKVYPHARILPRHAQRETFVW